MLHGTTHRSRALTAGVTSRPLRLIPSMVGTVPNPNINIYPAPSHPPDIVVAPAKAMYTNPHGSSPFRAPRLPREITVRRLNKLPIRR